MMVSVMARVDKLMSGWAECRGAVHGAAVPSIGDIFKEKLPWNGVVTEDGVEENLVIALIALCSWNYISVA